MSPTADGQIPAVGGWFVPVFMPTGATRVLSIHSRVRVLNLDFGTIVEFAAALWPVKTSLLTASSEDPLVKQVIRFWCILEIEKEPRSSLPIMNHAPSISSDYVFLSPSLGES